MNSQVESSGAEFANEPRAEGEVGGDLESIRTWAHVWTLVSVLVSLVLIAMTFSDRSRPSGSTVLLSFLLIGLCRVITVFAAALQRIERKVQGLPPVG